MSALMRKVSELGVYLHYQSKRFFANVSLYFNLNKSCMAFAHVAILLSSMQRFEEYVMALNNFDYSAFL